MRISSRRRLVGGISSSALAKGSFLLATGIVALGTASAAAAQPPAVEAAFEPAPESEVVVTGTRIVRDGYSAPTPVSVISTEEINREAPANISDFVNTLPAVRGSATPANSNGALSNGQAGISTVNLRNLGANRTLVLLDGQRSVASAVNGNVDVNTIPQALIERVEVVTGGASSAYGSDAVSGVVNFILNKTFTGVKGEYEYGVTTYGDGSNHKISLTAGTAFGENRGHFIVSGEYYTQTGIQSVDRDWNDSGFFQILNPAYSAAACTDSSAATPCVNQYLVTKGAGSGNFTPGGLIASARNATGGSVTIPASLLNTYFGTINPSTGLATTGKLAVGPRNGQWMLGGDYQYASSSHVGTGTLLPSERRKGAFARLSWEFAPWMNVFGQFGYSYYRGASYYQLTPSQANPGGAATDTGAFSVSVNNPYLPTDVRSTMVANGISSLVVSSGNAGLPPQGSDMSREVFRYVLGGDGEFAALGRSWRWDAYYQKGIAKTNELLTNTWNYQRMSWATDAVDEGQYNGGLFNGTPNGNIVCRAVAAGNPAATGCLPLNRIGVGGMDPRAVDYVMYANEGLNPTRKQKLTQDVAAISFSTNNLFELPAGPVSLAFGGEWRKEAVSGTVDELFMPIITPIGTSGVNSLTPTWRYGNFIPTVGSYNVKEAFVETIIPIIKGMDLNGAFRLTDYSTSGTVNTWKVGVTWQAIDDIKLRGTVSRDIRAPNLADLYNAGGGATNAITRPASPGSSAMVSDGMITSQVGNLNLKPEIARTYGAGAVFTPTFLPGFAASIDYYRISIKGSIGSLGINTIADQCYRQNIAESCNAIITTGGQGVLTSGGEYLDVISVLVQPRNYIVNKAEGIDFEASYRRRIGPGTMQLRALANWAIKNTTNTGIPNDAGVIVITNSAGNNSGSLPDWSFRLSAAYNLDNGLSFQAVGRGVTSGTYGNNNIVCTTDCPVSTVDYNTINTNHIPGAWYIDVNAEYKFEISKVKAAAFLSIRNLFNKDPVLVANGPTGDNTEAYPQTNRNLYDVLGRVFRLGLRFDY